MTVRTSGATPALTPRWAGGYTVTRELPPHLRDWQLPPGWNWGSEGVAGDQRHYQEIVDALGRSLALVSAADPAHHAWLAAEARNLGHRNHPAIPTTYHYWASFSESGRGPGYLRRWIAGETIGARLLRTGPDDTPGTIRLLREIGSTLSYLHGLSQPHGSVVPSTIWVAPMGRMWMLGWQWAIPASEIPAGVAPDLSLASVPPEWTERGWIPTAQSDQWQLGALCFLSLTGEMPPSDEIPPISLLRPDCPRTLAAVIDRALQRDPHDRFESVAGMIRAIDRVIGTRPVVVAEGDAKIRRRNDDVEEEALRWAVADEYEVLARLGSGSFGSVWCVRDLSLGREVALKVLHAHVARDERAVGRFRREARLAAQLAHPAIVPIFDWDNRDDISWYTMELAEGGSVADLIARSGARPLAEIAPQVDFALAGLGAAHSIGIVHRDLKPENILIDRYRRWRIADFGIANAAGEEKAGASGTPAFAAPEQLLGEHQDTAADCFSFAAIVAFTLTGAPPFGQTDPRAILARELRGDIDLSGIDPEIAEWLRSGLSASPEARFEDAAAMRTAWRRAVAEVFERERVPWWRRWLATEDNPSQWTEDPAI